MRVGIGYDLHKLVEGEKLILGGVEIPHGKGLLGHSDADALLHAIADAILGASGLPDIGHFFPDDDPKYENISSAEILERVLESARFKRLRVEQVDAVVIAEEPKLAPYMEQIVLNVANLLALPKDRVGIKAKTNEGLGILGSGEAIAAFAVVVLSEEG